MTNEKVPEPIKIELPDELYSFLEENDIENVIVAVFLTVIGPVLRFYVRETSFTQKIIESPELLGDISIIGKYAKIAKIRNGPIIYLRDFRVNGKYLLIIFEVKRISSRVEKILDIFIKKIIEKKDLSPILIIDVLHELVKL